MIYFTYYLFVVVVVLIDWPIFSHMHDYFFYINSIVFFIYFMFFSDERLMLETLEFTFYIGSTRKFLYFDLFVNTAYAAHYVYCIIVLLYSFSLFIFYFAVCTIETSWNFISSHLASTKARV